MRGPNRNSGQVMVEYAAVILCVVAALAAAGIYFQRAYQGRMRDTADQIGDQYEPAGVTMDMTTYVAEDTTTIISKDDTPETYLEGVPGYGTWVWEASSSTTERAGFETIEP